MPSSEINPRQGEEYAFEAIMASGDLAYRWDLLDDRMIWIGDAAAFSGEDRLQHLETGAAYMAMLQMQGARLRKKSLNLHLNDQLPFECEYQMELENGTHIWIHERGRIQLSDDGTTKHMFGMLRNITRSKLQTSELEYQASYDDLTGHLNKARLREAMQSTLTYNQRYKIAGGYLAIGIDKLSMINDGYGNAVADAVIIGVGQIIERCLRSSDVIGRIDGDRFGCILAHCDMDGMKIAAEKILDALRSLPVETPEGPIRVTVSVGGTGFSSLTSTAHDAMTAAETALAQAKAQGRNCYVPYTVTDEQRTEQRGNIALGETVTQALADNRIVLAYQPVIEAKTRRVEYHECLIRMIDEDGNLVPAGMFIPVVEKLGMIKPLDQRALEIAIDDLSRHPDIRLAVNVSGYSVTNPAWMRTLVSLVKHRPEIARRLSIEITETVALDDFSITEQFISSVRSLGCKIALDDFGSGYTSFMHMKTLTVDVVKIDGTFVTDIATSTENQMFVRSLLGLVDGFGLQSVAECIETQEDADILTDEGADYLQGWYFGKPLTDPDWRQ